MRTRYRLFSIGVAAFMLVSLILPSRSALAQPAECTVDTATCDFAGWHWTVRDGGTKPSEVLTFSKNGVSGDALGLHLKLTQDGQGWHGAEVDSTREAKYGLYCFNVEGRMDQLQNVVLGLFVYRNDSQEVDTEFSTWGNSHPKNSQFVIQPTSIGGSDGFLVQFDSDLGAEPTPFSSTHCFDWEPLYVKYWSLKGTYSAATVQAGNYPVSALLAPSATSDTVNVPQYYAGAFHVIMNLYIYGSNGYATDPIADEPTEVVVTNFRYLPHLPSWQTMTFDSVGTQDGTILESREASNQGGTQESIGTTFNLGDDRLNRQYRSVLSFNTKGLPDTAVLRAAMIRIRQKSAPIGGNPFAVLGKLLVDERRPYFGSSPALDIADFNSPADVTVVPGHNMIPMAGWHGIMLNQAALNRVNKAGTTQFRLRFARDDNNNFAANYQMFFSGNSSMGKPEFVVTYYLPLAYDEARVRYILADVELGGPIGYYRGFPNDANCAEAVLRWDAGVRVVNTTAFERKIVNGTWQIVYAGTNTTLNGMDVILTTD